MAEKKEKTEAVKEEEVKETPKKKSTTKKTTSKSTTTEKKTTAKKATTKKETAKKETTKKEPAKKKTTSKKVSENAAELEELVKELPGEEILLNVNPEDDEKIPLDPESGLDPEQLETELNDLKDLVQGEIDKMMEENPDADWADVVKEARNNKKNPKKTNVKLCECCEEVEVEDDQVYCPECLEKLRHYPFEWWKLFIPIIAIILFFLCCSYFAVSFPIYKSTVSANKLAKEGKLNSALIAFESINAEIKVTDSNYGFRYLNYQIDVFNKIGIFSYDDLYTFLNTYYEDEDFDKWYNKDAKAAKEELESYDELYDCFDTASASATTYEEFLTSFNALVDKKGYDEALTYYFRADAAFRFEEFDEMKKNIEKIKEVDPSKQSLYLPLMAEFCLNQNKYEDCIKYAGEFQNLNSEIYLTYLYKSTAYRLLGNYTKAMEECEAGLKMDSENSYLYAEAAIVALLQGDYQLAYTYAGDAYTYMDSYSAFMTSASLYSLSAQLLGYDDVNASIEEAAYGYISPDVAKIVSGEKTLEDVFKSGAGDLSWN